MFVDGSGASVAATITQKKKSDPHLLEDRNSRNAVHYEHLRRANQVSASTWWWTFCSFKLNIFPHKPLARPRCFLFSSLGTVPFSSPSSPPLLFLPFSFHSLFLLYASKLLLLRCIPFSMSTSNSPTAPFDPSSVDIDGAHTVLSSLDTPEEEVEETVKVT